MSHGAVKGRLDEVFAPTQVGVGMKSGAESIVRAATVLVKEHGDNPDMALLKVDFENAFNRCSRKIIFEQVEKEFPGRIRWARWCYGTSSHLFASRTHLPTPFGAALFS